MNKPIPPAFVVGCASVLLAILIPLSDLQAATYHWGGGTTDIEGTGTPAGGAGTWNTNTAIQNWTLNTYSGSGEGYVAWPGTTNNEAVFGGAAGTVTIGSPVTFGNLAVETAGYVFTIGANITLTHNTLSGAELASSSFQATSGSRVLVFSGTGSSTYPGTLNNGGGTLGFRVGSAREVSLTGTNNSYTGVTAIFAGQLNISSIADGGVNSSIGASSSAAASISFGNSTAGAALNYVGSGASTDRLFTLTGTTNVVNHRILNNGSGALAFTNTGPMVHAGSNNQVRTFTLGGTNTNNNTMAVQLVNNSSAAMGLGKTDTGTWIVTGNNTYSGATTVNGGVLEFSGAALGNNNNTAITIGEGGTMRFNTMTNTSRTNSISGEGVFEKSGAATLTISSAAHTGGTVVSAGVLELATNGTMLFSVQEDGVNTSVSGVGAAVFNGAFNIDLSAAGTTLMDSWTLIAISNRTYGTNFIVNGFDTSGDGIWTRETNSVTYEFSQISGVLFVSDAPPPDPYTNWLTNYPSLTNTSPSADPDEDGFDNGMEFAFDGDPTVGTPALLGAVKSGTNVVFSYVGRIDSEPNYHVLSTTNLSEGPWATNNSVTVTNSADQSGILLPADYVRREFAVPGIDREYFRVKAEIP